MSQPAAALPAHGVVLGRYRPIRPLGSGGSGSVWLAWDEAAGIEVALKIVGREGKAADRAEREVAAAARLRHERCLRALALAHDDRHVYIAYEYVPGRTIREALRAGELDDGAAVEAAAQILEGLAHAHARGIVHRDVKPSNVLLAEGDGVSVRLLDFGLARMDEAETLTAAGDVPGTLAYIAPERLSGDPTTPAADVWAVGVLLWEALAGWHPFWRSSLLESARAIEEGAPPLATARPDLPKALAAAVDRALSLNPARRPSAEKLATALRRARSDRRRDDGTARVEVALPAAPTRIAPAALSAAFAGATATAFPFFPARWPAALALAAAATAAWRPRAGAAVALAVPVLPLGNVSLGLALLYAAVALAWFALFAREPDAALLPAVGPLLGAIGGLPLLPLLALTLRSPIRRALAVLAAIAAAAVTAGVRGSRLAFAGAPPPPPEIARVESPLVVARELVTVVTAAPTLPLAAAALAAVAAAIPLAMRHGIWGAAAVAAAILVTVGLLAPAAPAVPLVVTAWATFAALALKYAR